MNVQDKIKRLQDSIEALQNDKAALTNKINQQWDELEALKREAVVDRTLLLNLTWRIYDYAQLYLDTEGTILIATNYATDADPEPVILAPGVRMCVDEVYPVIKGTFDVVRDWAHANNLIIDWSDIENTEQYCKDKLFLLQTIRDRWGE